jgi:hypothetical protein
LATLEVISGRISHVGKSSSDAYCRTYNSVEIESVAGRVSLTTAVAANELDRAIKEGALVSMSIFEAGEGSNRRCVVLGVYDEGLDRTFFNEEMFTLKAHARKQAVLYSFLSVVLVPVGLLLFVVPGLLWLWVLWKAWSAIDTFPGPDEIRASVESLSAASR